MDPVRVHVMPGLGDAIYHRPFVRNLAMERPVILHTKWPELFSDLPNIEFAPPDKASSGIRPWYNTKTLKFRSIPDAIGSFFPKSDLPLFLDLPRDPLIPPPYNKYAAVRLPVLRSSFYAPARNPAPVYINAALNILKENSFITVSVANADGKFEWVDGVIDEANIPRVRGEFSTQELLWLIQEASCVVGGPGWQVPAAIAYGAPAIIIYGGFGAANTVKKLTAPWMDYDIRTIEPDNFCMKCPDVTHDCDKTISNFEEKFHNALSKA